MLETVSLGVMTNLSYQLDYIWNQLKIYLKIIANTNVSSHLLLVILCILTWHL